MNPPIINVTIPVYNEAAVLERSIGRVAGLLQSIYPDRHEIVIVNNASIDRTLEIAQSLAAIHPNVRVLHLEERGRGRAVKRAWRESKAEILSYMDVDLSTDLAAFPRLIEPLMADSADLAVGSRLLPGSRTCRGIKREFISRGYNFLVKACFGTRFSDAQCGFKAIRRKASLELLPLIADNHWFMDTELLVVAEKLGYRIFDLPVAWVDDEDSRVKILHTAIEDLRGILRLRRNLKHEKYVRIIGN